MILLCEKITRLSEIFNRRHNVILHRVARTINASRRVLKKTTFITEIRDLSTGKKVECCLYCLSQAYRGNLSPPDMQKRYFKQFLPLQYGEILCRRATKN